MGYVLVDKIHTLRLCCHKVLPAVYDESLSYLEQLAKLTYKVNETIESVNALNDNVDFLNDTVVDFGQRLAVVENDMATFEAEITQSFNTLEQQVNATVDAKLAEVDAKIEDINREMTVFEAAITSRMNQLERTLTDLLNAEIAHLYELYNTFEIEMRGYVDEQIQRLIDSIPDLTNVNVLDPTTGIVGKIQTAINNMFVFSAHYAFTCDEYNKLGLTCDELMDIVVNSLPIGMTIYEWLSKAKLILLTQVDEEIAETFAYPHTFVRDYLDGSIVWHDRNVDINQGLIATSGCFDCNELNTMAFTCDEIVAFGLTCYEYIMRANTLMIRT